MLATGLASRANLMKFAKLMRQLRRAMPLQIDIRAGGEVHYLRSGI
ncbi:hypothetical protein SY94_5304 (plasmid) [Agrobacterium tumefaciens]|nr:hypothetical protein SY94_5304 [Agrobacterium tumefaciens]